MLRRQTIARAVLIAVIAGVGLYFIFRDRPHVLPLSIIFGVAIGGRYLTWIALRARRAAARAAATPPPGPS